MSKIKVKYQTIEFNNNIDIHIKTLKNNQQFEDIDDVAQKLGISSAQWPLFGILWPSSIILANLVLSYNIKNKRILEIGCGIALASHILNHRLADITSTDYHPSVEEFLISNTKLNNGKEIPFERTAWNDNNDNLGKFDLIIGSDLLYEETHIEELSNFINNHSNKSCEVIIIDPGRNNLNKFTRKMKQYSFESSINKDLDLSNLNIEFKGKVIHYNR